MKWTIRVELTPDGNEPITCDIGTITRPIVDLSPEQIGLTLEEGPRFRVINISDWNDDHLELHVHFRATRDRFVVNCT